MNEIIDNPIRYIETRAKSEGISINAICKEAGIDRSTFTRIKNGTCGGTFKTIGKLVKAVDMLSTT